MPTASKVVAAIIFAFVAWLTVGLVIPHLHAVQPGKSVGWLGLVCAAIGALSGWSMSGARAGDGIRASIGYGLTTVALIVFWGLFVAAGEEAFQRSIATRYDGPIQAISDMITLMMSYGKIMLQADVVIWLLIGAFFGGVMTELISRKWS